MSYIILWNEQYSNIYFNIKHLIWYIHFKSDIHLIYTVTLYLFLFHRINVFYFYHYFDTRFIYTTLIYTTTSFFSFEMIKIKLIFSVFVFLCNNIISILNSTIVFKYFVSNNYFMVTCSNLFAIVYGIWTNRTKCN